MFLYSTVSTLNPVGAWNERVVWRARMRQHCYLEARRLNFRSRRNARVGEKISPSPFSSADHDLADRFHACLVLVSSSVFFFHPNCTFTFSSTWTTFGSASACAATDLARSPSSSSFFFAPFVLTDGRDGGDDLSQLELVEDGGFTSCVESHHEDAHLFLGEEPGEDPADGEPHGVGGTRGLIQTSVDSWPNV